MKTLIKSACFAVVLLAMANTTQAQLSFGVSVRIGSGNGSSFCRTPPPVVYVPARPVVVHQPVYSYAPVQRVYVAPAPCQPSPRFVPTHSGYPIITVPMNSQRYFMERTAHTYGLKTERQAPAPRQQHSGVYGYHR
jgi:hypothetical protein